MNHWQLVIEYKGKTIQVYDSRIVRIIGASVPGSALCKAVDNGTPIFEVSTAYLSTENIVAE